MLRLPVAVLALLALPAPAGASCAARPFEHALAEAQVVVEALALDGPRHPDGPLWTPARFTVLHADRGAVAGDELSVETGATERTSISVGLFPRPGERFRLLGRWRDGVLRTSACSGSSRLEAPVAAPRLDLAGASVVASRADLDGGTPGPAPVVVATRAAHRVRSNRRLAFLRLVRDGRVVARATSRDGLRWSVGVPPGEHRLVADTGAASFAVVVRR